MLFVATLCLIKLSIVILLWLITPAEDHRRLLMVTAAFVVVTGLVSEFTEAFQCRVPSTWDFLGNNQCFDQVSLSAGLGVNSLVLTRPRLLSGDTLVLDIGASVVLLAFTSEFDSPNVTVDLFAWVLITQIVQCVTITTSCIPYLRPLLKAYPSGMFKNDDVRRKGTKISYAAGSRDQEIETVALRAPSNSSHTGKEALSSHRESSIGPSVEEA
ncbi:MAG: hypothetical protein LQ340_007302 [Diploschistes diacapsis]|nr:MAG: hypothetical protein LQ340_007302 [Diploschistes diacapsis]